jgi:hypothetical protein
MYKVSFKDNSNIRWWLKDEHWTCKELSADAFPSMYQARIRIFDLCKTTKMKEFPVELVGPKGGIHKVFKRIKTVVNVTVSKEDGTQ